MLTKEAKIEIRSLYDSYFRNPSGIVSVLYLKELVKGHYFELRKIVIKELNRIEQERKRK